ncbi:hypothetical protein PV327_008883, partial [Microctonus hyperodae]
MSGKSRRKVSKVKIANGKEREIQRSHDEMNQVYLKCALAAVAIAADVGSIVNITVSSATVTVIAAILDTAC